MDHPGATDVSLSYKHDRKPKSPFNTAGLEGKGRGHEPGNVGKERNQILCRTSRRKAALLTPRSSLCRTSKRKAALLTPRSSLCRTNFAVMISRARGQEMGVVLRPRGNRVAIGKMISLHPLVLHAEMS